MGETFADVAASGPLLLGIAVAAIAGVVSFFSPCILPLVPGYLAYVTGLSGADADSGARTGPAGGGGSVAVAAPSRQQPRVLAGTLLFVAGFGTVFITTSVIAASVGGALQEHRRMLEITGGALMIVFALALLGLVPVLQREVRIRRLPAAGLAGAPVFGAVFALSWIPCLGPTIGAVLALGMVSGQTGRAVVLASAYTLGIGLPFLAFGLGLRWFISAVGAVRRHGAWVTRIGAVLLIVVGLALLSGAWEEFVSWLRINAGVGEVSV
jgi:cytochrome c-type biogenesis protein